MMVVKLKRVLQLSSSIMHHFLLYAPFDPYFKCMQIKLKRGVMKIVCETVWNTFRAIGYPETYIGGREQTGL